MNEKKQLEIIQGPCSSIIQGSHLHFGWATAHAEHLQLCMEKFVDRVESLCLKGHQAHHALTVPTVHLL